MNSIEKLAKMQAELMDSAPEDEQTARWAQAAGSLLPIIGPMLPEDPAELDQYLLRLAAWALTMRSDDAPDYLVCELEGPRAPETHVIVLRTEEQESGRVDIRDVRFEPMEATSEPAEAGEEA